MNAAIRWIVGLTLLLAAASLPAQTKFTLKASLDPATCKPGDTVTLVLDATVARGWHAYGTKETTNIPVALKPAKLQLGGLELDGAAAIPPGDRKEAFGLATFPLPNEFQVTQKLKVPAAMAAGEVTVAGALDYQICDENSCLPPAAAKFSVKLVVTGGAVPLPQDPKAQGETKPGLQLEITSDDEKLKLVPRVSPVQVRPGETVQVELTVTVDRRYHAYGTKETTNLPVDFDATKWQLGGLELDGRPKIPPGEKKEQFGLETFPLPHEFEVAQGLKVPAGAKPGKVEVRGVLKYQLCDENSCDLPAELPFQATVEVVEGAAREPAVPAEAPVVPEDGGETAAPAGSPADGLGDSLWALILACIGGGLFALVMPCTYPMIPITFTFFTKQADARGGKVLTLAVTYGLGIVVMFTAIGALAGVVGDKIVEFSAHWITNVVIGGAFLVFALSLLGWITIQPPAFLTQAAGKSRSVGGVLGVLLMGATLVISSFTCTAPIVALLLLPAVQSGDASKPTIGMAVFGLTMALPFVMLALLPGRVKALPRSGEWMNTLKVSLGVIELAAALKFFSNAEYAELLYILPREVFFAIWIALFGGLAVYLFGLLPKAAVGTGRRIGGVASLVFAGYCLYGALGYPQDFVMNALAPAYSLKDLHKEKIVVDSDAGHPRSTDDYEAAVEHAKANGKLVLVNFTGFTCSNCRMVERGLMPSPRINPLLKQHFVEARLHMDNPDAIPAAQWRIQEGLRQTLMGGLTTTPSYVTVDPVTGAKLFSHVLSGGPGAWEAGYLAFLEQSLQKAGRNGGKPQ